jgi:phage repressor protein C with HTH and peptisase S24 domain
MEPTIVDGQGLIGVTFGRVRVGQIRTFEHPDRPGFWMVKRVSATDGGSMIVESDNRDIRTEDSHSFGPVDATGSYRIVLRIPRRWM